MPSDASTLPAPAPCTPEEFDIFWEKVEELELQDVLQCIGDDLSAYLGRLLRDDLLRRCVGL